MMSKPCQHVSAIDIFTVLLMAASLIGAVAIGYGRAGPRPSVSVSSLGAAAGLHRPHLGPVHQAGRSASADGHGVLALVAGRFPQLAPSLRVEAEFAPTSARIGGIAIPGLTAAHESEAPQDLKSQERAAWLAMAQRQAPARLTVFFPRRYRDGCLIQVGGMDIHLKPLDALDATAETDHGHVVYRGIHPHTDALYTASPDRSEEFLYLADGDAPRSFAYDLDDHDGAIRIESERGGLRCSDERGHVAHLEAPYVIDAAGHRSATAVRWDLASAGIGAKRRLTMVVDPRGLTYPLAIDPSWSATSGVMATIRVGHTATLLPSGEVLVAGGDGAGQACELFHPDTGLWMATGATAAVHIQHAAQLLPTGKVLVIGGFDYQDASRSCELYDPASGAWSATGELIHARYNATSTMLPSGQVLVTGGNVGMSGVLSSCELYDPATGTWSATGAMGSSRSGHTATMLADGKVLVAAGWNSTATTTTCEVYDPSAGTWSATGALADARWLHTATLLPSGQVLVAGGDDDGAFDAIATSELYDPISRTWRATQGPLATARLHHSATLLPNGTVLVAGGYDGPGTLGSTEIFDPATGLWSPGGAMAERRAMFTATLQPSGRVLVAGGIGDNAYPTRSELFDPSTGSWHATVSGLGEGRLQHTATLLPSGEVLVAGGIDALSHTRSSCELFDPVTETWRPTAPLATARFNHSATLLTSGKVLIAGGRDDTNASMASCELYDPASGTWAPTGAMLEATDSHTATLLPSEKVLAAGGIGSNVGGFLRDSELYDPIAGTWTATAGPMTLTRFQHSATLLASGKVLIAGGEGDVGDLLISELYDPVADAWTTTGTLGVARRLHTATLLPSGKVLVAGGIGANIYLSSCELYDPAAGTWSATGTMSTERLFHTATLLPSGMVIALGSYTFPTSECYDPSAGTWRLEGDATAMRIGQTATLLPSGRVLAAGGYNFSAGDLASSELYDPESGEPWAIPVIGSASWPVQGAEGAAGALIISGSGFSPRAEATSGTASSSPTNHPLVQITSQASERQVWLQSAIDHPYTDTAFTSANISGLPVGQAQVRVFVNGIGSAARLISVRRPVSLSWPAPAAIAYGTVLSGAQLDATASFPGSFVYSPGAGTVLHVGVHTLSATFTPTDGSSHGAGTVTTSIVVRPHALIITANAAVRRYGGANPPLGYTVQGLVGADAIASATLGTTANASSPLGSYPILVGDAIFAAGSAADYTISYVNATLTVAPTPLLITADDKTRRVGESGPSLTASYSGFVNGDSPASLTSPLVLATTALQSSPVCSYPITASGAVAPNYDVTFAAGTLSVIPATEHASGHGGVARPCGQGAGFAVGIGMMIACFMCMRSRRR